MPKEDKGEIPSDFIDKKVLRREGYNQYRKEVMERLK